MGEPQQKCLFSLALTSLAILSTLPYLQDGKNGGHSGAEKERVLLSDIFISLKTTACYVCKAGNLAVNIRIARPRNAL